MCAILLAYQQQLRECVEVLALTARHLDRQMIERSAREMPHLLARSPLQQIVLVGTTRETEGRRDALGGPEVR